VREPRLPLTVCVRELLTNTFEVPQPNESTRTRRLELGEGLVHVDLDPEASGSR